MVEHTDYWVLTAVAVVALVAIGAMSASVSPVDPQPAPGLTFVPLDEPVGMAASPTHKAAPPELLENNPYDYNGDGLLSQQDSLRLADAFFDQKCPYKKSCDLNSDGMINEQDLALLNAMVLEQDSTPLTGNVVSQPVARTVSSSRSVASHMG